MTKAKVPITVLPLHATSLVLRLKALTSRLAQVRDTLTSGTIGWPAECTHKHNFIAKMFFNQITVILNPSL